MPINNAWMKNHKFYHKQHKKNKVYADVRNVIE